MPMTDKPDNASKSTQYPRSKSGDRANPLSRVAIIVLLLGLASSSSGNADTATGLTAGSFITGADMSGVKYVEDRGKKYLDAGRAEDPFLIAKTHGINFIRLRLYTSWPLNGGGS
jgi:arabinogalactan endo-1,4-beta-galactosidase